MLTLGSDLAPLKDPGEFLGVWRFISDVGGAVGPPLIGGIAQIVALASATWFTGGVAGIGALALITRGQGDSGEAPVASEAKMNSSSSPTRLK